MSGRARRLVWGLVRLGLSVLLVWLVVRGLDTAAVAAQVADADGRLLATAVAIFSVALWAGCTKWWLLLAALGPRVPWRTMLGHYFVGLLFNLVLPGGVGGDLARGVRLHQHVKRPADIALSVVIDRVVGLLSMFAVGAVALALSPAVRATPLALGYVAIGGSLGLGFALVAFAPARRLALRIANAAGVERLAGAAEAIDGSLGAIRFTSPLFLGAVALAVLTHATNIAVYACLDLALGLGVGVAVLGLFYPLVTLIGVIPLTIGGVGLREAAGAQIFEANGDDPAKAVALTLVWFGIVVAYSLLGAIPLVRGYRTPSASS